MDEGRRGLSKAVRTAACSLRLPRCMSCKTQVATGASDGVMPPGLCLQVLRRKRWRTGVLKSSSRSFPCMRNDYSETEGPKMPREEAQKASPAAVPCKQPLAPSSCLGASPGINRVSCSTAPSHPCEAPSLRSFPSLVTGLPRHLCLAMPCPSARQWHKLQAAGPRPPSAPALHLKSVSCAY